MTETLRERLRRTIAAVSVEVDAHSDNLAIALCSYFEGHIERPEDDEETENGWGEWVEGKADFALEAIANAVADEHESALSAAREEAARAERERLQGLIKSAYVEGALDFGEFGDATAQKARARFLGV